VTAIDMAGNQQQASASFTVDTALPTATYTGEPASVSTTASLNVTVGGTGVLYYQHELLNGVAADCANAGYSTFYPATPLITDSLADWGTYKFCIKGQDSYDNVQTAFRDGTTHLLFTPTEFIEKLVALIPSPRSHLVRWSGVLAPHSPYRQAIILRPDVKKGFQFGVDDEKRKMVKNHTWSKVLASVF